MVLPILRLGVIIFTCVLMTGCGASEEQTKSSNNNQDDTRKYQDTTLVKVDEEPVFPGGEEAMFDFIKNELNYPSKAKIGGKEGTVFIKFIVTKEGEVTDPVVKKGSSTALNQEALRVIKAMPDWEPGKKDGEKVNAYFILPIRFSLN